MKKVLSFIALLVTALALVGCSTNPDAISKFVENAKKRDNFTIEYYIGETLTSKTEVTKNKKHDYVVLVGDTYYELDGKGNQTSYLKGGILGTITKSTQEGVGKVYDNDSYLTAISYLKSENYVYSKEAEAFVNEKTETKIVISNGTLTLTFGTDSSKYVISSVGSTKVEIPKDVK